MIHWTIISGIGQKNTVTVKTTGGAVVPLTGSEAFNCYYWTGETQHSLGSLTWAYNVLAAGTVDITVPATVAGSLGQGLYQWVLELPDGSAAYARGSFEVVAGPGSSDLVTSAYCSYNEVLNYAPWVRLCASPDSDQTGFLDKRVIARNWLDMIIARSWRGTSQAYFGDAGRTAQFWLGGWVRRTPMTSQWLLDFLQGTNVGGGNPNLQQVLIQRPWVHRVTAFRAIYMIGMAQVGINNQYAVYGRVFGERAEAEVYCQSADLDLVNTPPSVASLAVPLGSTNTLFT
jgi:hypothetical protein